MKYVAVSLATALAISMAVPCFADSDNAVGPIPVSTVIQNLNNAGYPAINEIEFANGVYKVKAFSATGQKLKLSVDSNGNLMPNNSPNQPAVSMLAAAQAVEKQNYKIHEIEYEHGSYQVKAVDNNGKSVNLNVNPTSGLVSKSMF